MGPDGGGGGGGQAQQQGDAAGGFGGGMWRFAFQMGMAMFMMNAFTERSAKKGLNKTNASGGVGAMPDGLADASGYQEDGIPQGPGRGSQKGLRNAFGQLEECQLFVHYALSGKGPGLAAVLDEKLAAEQGLHLLWKERVWYDENLTAAERNVSVGPLAAEVLQGAPLPYLLATVVRVADLESGAEVPAWQVMQDSIPLAVKMRDLDAEAGAENLFADDAAAQANTVKKNSSKVLYWKTKIQVRPVWDHQVHNQYSLKQGPFRKLKIYPEAGVYAPYLYMSDFWLLEKDYVPLNETLASSELNLTISYEPISMWKWTMQAQMNDQWSHQSEWGLTDTQRDSFMLKRLIIDTNPYLLAFSAAFIGMHTIFSFLAFKNDVQFWRNNESMQGLSARSMIISWVCQFITALYLLDSQETSRLLLFEISLDAFLSTWKLKKAVKIELKPSFPFVSIGGQKGYEEKSTSKYDEEAFRYMGALLTPLFVGYSIRSLLYGKHRGWWSFAVNAAAGGVYTFGFVMMTPQLYINYKLKSVEHLPWRALTYKAFNTFIDDIAALLIDMPFMHRISCFRDDIIFFIYLYQRWAYRTDKSRPSMWVDQSELELPAPAEAADGGAAAGKEDADGTAKSNCDAGKPDAAKADGKDAAAQDSDVGHETAAAAEDASADGLRQRR